MPGDAQPLEGRSVNALRRFVGATIDRIIRQPRYWTLPGLLWTSVVAGSLLWNWNAIDRHTRELAANQGRFIFRMIESIRLWNARHGGVYVLVDAETQPNPYLDVPERDIVSDAGKRLTMVNPAYMTRQLTDIIRSNNQIAVHITSLKPINPGNAADPWESEALRAFERGLAERAAFVTPGDGYQFRYMAPLVTKTPCLKCHEKQGYRVGDIRGGISVSFSAGPFVSVSRQQKTVLAVIHGAVWLLLSSLSVVFLWGYRERLLALAAAKAQQDVLVEKRTAELAEEVHERRQAEDRLRLLIDSSGEGILGVDSAGRCTLVNPVALRLLGYETAAELIGRDPCEVICATGRDAPGPECGLAGAFNVGRAAYDTDAQFRRRDGSILPVEYRAHPIYDGDRLAGAVITFSDITERKRSQEEIWRQANYDALTGLPNRSLFQDRLERAIAQGRRSGEGVGLMYIDLDGFKAVNDTLGHAAGDALLAEAARRMSACLRDSDTLARTGGDEFVAILPLVASRQEVEQAACRITAALAQPFGIGGEMVRSGGSIGIAMFPADAETAELLVVRADAAMYGAKRAGGGTYRCCAAAG
jgi:diguanylate cyclase (GGDEF)-like protein/PAS domain S-box-containing protein